jgi:hypothetical protein
MPSSGPAAATLLRRWPSLPADEPPLQNPPCRTHDRQHAAARHMAEAGQRAWEDSPSGAEPRYLSFDPRTPRLVLRLDSCGRPTVEQVFFSTLVRKNTENDLSLALHPPTHTHTAT